MPPEMLKRSPFKDVDQLIDTCHRLISYELSFLLGNIIDLLPEMDDEETANELHSALSLLQRKLKNGVPSLTAISICESLFWDRYIAVQVSNILRNESLTSSDLDLYLMLNKDRIHAYLEELPSYFSERFSNFIVRDADA